MKITSLVRITYLVVGIMVLLSAATPAPASSQVATTAPTLESTQSATAHVPLSGAALTQVCQQYVKAALDATNKGCADTGRNQVCYGNISIKAEPQTGITNFSFDQPGQIVPISSLQKLQLGILNPDDQTWGVALFRIQADLPDTAPGQNVTLLAFGDVDLQNAGTSGLTIAVSTSTIVTARTMPSNTGPTVAVLPASYALTATGRSQDGTWLQVQAPGDASKHGWVPASAVGTSGDLSTLSVIDPSKPIYGPMQAFYLRTGVGEAACKDAPPDGILIQSPKQKAKVTISVNDVKIALGSTLYLQTQKGDSSTTSKLALATIEGSATVNAGGRQTVVNTGYQVEVPLDANGRASGAPGAVHPADITVLQKLPVQNMPVAVKIVAASAANPVRPTIAPGVTPAKTTGGSFVCPSGAVVVEDYNIPGVGAKHIVSGCTCNNGTHSVSFSQNTPQGTYTVNAQICN